MLTLCHDIKLSGNFYNNFLTLSGKAYFKISKVQILAHDGTGVTETRPPSRCRIRRHCHDRTGRSGTPRRRGVRDRTRQDARRKAQSCSSSPKPMPASGQPNDLTTATTLPTTQMSFRAQSTGMHLSVSWVKIVTECGLSSHLT